MCYWLVVLLNQNRNKYILYTQKSKPRGAHNFEFIASIVSSKVSHQQNLCMRTKNSLPNHHNACVYCLSGYIDWFGVCFSSACICSSSSFRWIPFVWIYRKHVSNEANCMNNMTIHIGIGSKYVYGGHPTEEEEEAAGKTLFVFQYIFIDLMWFAFAQVTHLCVFSSASINWKCLPGMITGNWLQFTWIYTVNLTN